MTRRVVVTGLGAVAPLGTGVDAVWNRLVLGHSGLVRLPDAVAADLPARVAGMVPDRADDPAGFDPTVAVAPKDLKKMDRFIQFAMVAAQEAVEQAGWHPADERARTRTATVIASGVGGFPAMMDAARTVAERGTRRLSPFVVPSFLANLAAGQVSIAHGFKGPLGAPVTACAAGAQAIGDGARMIRAGEVDVAVCGGAEACIDTVSLGGFAAARALSTGFNDRPSAASRPFDRRRDGFVMGEGAGVVVIEALEHALLRGATPLAELSGYGTTADAYHMTSGPEDGDGAARAMRQALDQAGLPPSAIGYLNAHATSTPVGDAGELAAIRTVFGAGAGVAISSTKSATGHLLGAAGGLEAVFSIQALRTGVLPPTLNLDEPDEAAAGLDLIGPPGRRTQVDYAMSNGFGFGGVNATLVFRRWAA
ncbi:beta-ketoacyl-ACP synthase II [Thalassobaculum sp.]|uniref:beta-ketoacyl-ACP synthase II n=1 Tax=Thalassobaculum sp. TaxID=2022740 RepID=UPI0032EBFB0F